MYKYTFNLNFTYSKKYAYVLQHKWRYSSECCNTLPKYDMQVKVLSFLIDLIILSSISNYRKNKKITKIPLFLKGSNR